MRHEPPVVAEVLPRLERGTSVRLPGGERARVVEQRGSQVLVYQPQLVLGRGPWIFQRYQVEPL